MLVVVSGVTSLYVTLSELPEYNDKIVIGNLSFFFFFFFIFTFQKRKSFLTFSFFQSVVAHLMTPPVVLKYNHPMVPNTIDRVNAVAVILK